MLSRYLRYQNSMSIYNKESYNHEQSYQTINYYIHLILVLIMVCGFYIHTCTGTCLFMCFLFLGVFLVKTPISWNQNSLNSFDHKNKYKQDSFLLFSLDRGIPTWFGSSHENSIDGNQIQRISSPRDFHHNAGWIMTFS